MFLSTFYISEAGIDVVKSGGKKCGNSVCYNYVRDKVNGDDRKITCTGSGINECPSYGVATLLNGYSVNIDVIVSNIESKISNGQTNGYVQMQCLDLDGFCAYYQWSGSINDEGFIELELYIDAL